MSLSGGYIGDVTNVTQLIGVDAVSLIRMIVNAALTVRAHKKNYMKFAQQLDLLGNLLEQLSVSELKKHHCTREPLELLEDALRRSYILLNSYQDCNYLYLLVMGWNIMKQLRSAQTEIAQYLDLIPLITLVNIQRVKQESTDNIKRDQHEYTLDEADKKVQEPLSKSGLLMAGTSRLGVNDAFLQIFKFKELRSATKNFSNGNVIGQGGYGIVYKGWIKSTSSTTENSGPLFLKKQANHRSLTVVAVKRFSHFSRQGFRQFESEVKLLGSILHPNIIKLFGYCRHKKMLVYEFMVNGCLSDHLFQRARFQPLSWELRLKIAVGVARGLAFLHSLHIIHRDLKTANILLDSNFNPKVADFGLAIYSLVERESYVSQDVCGTMGYVAPEYVTKGHVNEKIDVYAFGVVLLEMLSGKHAYEILRIRRNTDVSKTSQQSSEDLRKTNETTEDVLCPTLLNYQDFVSSCTSDYQNLISVMDPALRERYPLKGARLAAQLAQSCVAHDPTIRPTMQEIVETLEHILTMDVSPTTLALEEVSDPFWYDINFSVSTTGYESASFDADIELSFSKLR